MSNSSFLKGCVRALVFIHKGRVRSHVSVGGCLCVQNKRQGFTAVEREVLDYRSSNHDTKHA